MPTSFPWPLREVCQGYVCDACFSLASSQTLPRLNTYVKAKVRRNLLVTPRDAFHTCFHESAPKLRSTERRDLIGA